MARAEMQRGMKLRRAVGLVTFQAHDGILGGMVPLALFTLGSASIAAPVEVRTKSFVFTSAGTQTWLNVATGTRLQLGANPLVELEVGDDAKSARPVVLQQAGPQEAAGDGSKAVVHLRSVDGYLAVTVTLQADPQWPILHKTVDVINTGTKPTRLLNLILGRYPAVGRHTEGSDRGFPIYVDGQFFMSLAHPAGFSHVEGDEIVLRQYPGARLAPGAAFHSMEAVYGVAKRGGARKLFVAYVRSRMARVKYGHDRPITDLESFGGQPFGDFKDNFRLGVSEAFLLDNLDQAAQARRDNGVQFDFYNVDFWQDRAGDLEKFNPHNFPDGFDRVRDKILAGGMTPALWIDSGKLADWTIDLNPAVKGCFTEAEGSNSLCRASEPIATIYKEGFLYQMQTNKVGLIKFDNLAAVCDNPAHDHLPGPLYSTEAIYDSLIDFLQTLRKANPNVFLMLYWGYRSPWWLLYGDTYFECGEQIEAASPAQYPTPYARQSVTQRLDQAQMNIVDTPWLGKDSLGVWLSDWAWNSRIGKARWQEGVIMDIARGGMLLQIWTDADFLTPPERAQLATFIDLFKANGECFDHTWLAIGDPRKAAPYGYACSDGTRAFLAVHNACLKDSVLDLKPGRVFGLPAGRNWDVYRWYPDPAKLAGGSKFSIAMRPYEVALLELVPHGAGPSLGRPFPDAGNREFSEPTCELPIDFQVKPEEPAAARWKAVKPSLAVSAKGATLKVLRDGSVLASGSNESNDTYTIIAKTDAKRITSVLLEALTDPSLPSQGPGRAVNGNLQLTDIRMLIAPRDHPNQVWEIKFRSADADFAQTSFGGWPASAIIDADPKTGWSIHPRVGRNHAVVLALAEPVELPKGAVLTLMLRQGSDHHNLGKFRVSIGDAPASVLPARYLPAAVSLQSTLPATKTGGLLFLVGDNPENSPSAAIAGRTIGLQPVWAADTNWSCPWAAWRAELGPSDSPRRVTISVAGLQPPDGTKFRVYFLPR